METIQSKCCTKCGVGKSLNDFYQNLTAKSGYNSVCKVCYRERSKERSKKIYQNEIIIAKIFVKNKICNTCHTEKNISSFSKKKENKDGYRNDCKSCRKIYEDNWKKENPSNLIVNAKKYRDKVEVKETIKKYRREYMQNKTNTNLLFKLKSRVSCRIREACRKNGFTKRSRTSEYIGCDWETFKNHIENNFQEGMSWDNYGVNGWHLDHHIPISFAKTEEDIFRLNHYTNLKPLWWEDNLKKSDKISEEWGNEISSN